MNQVMLFSDDSKKYYVIRIAGKDAIKYFQEKKLDVIETVQELQGGRDLDVLQGAPNAEALLKPKFPIDIGTEKKSKEVAKLRLDEGFESGELYVQPEDVKGSFDFIVDVQSMTLNASEDRKQTQQVAMSMLVSNPNVSMMLAQEGIKPKFKELFVTWLEDLGFTDADRFFERMLPNEGQSNQPAQLAKGLSQTPVVPSGSNIPIADGQIGINNQNQAGQPNLEALNKMMTGGAGGYSA
mgnify:CR=1 FL=1